MKAKEKNDLTMILLMQTVAGARNVKPIDRLEAIFKDVGLVIEGEEPRHSKELV